MRCSEHLAAGHPALGTALLCAGHGEEEPVSLSIVRKGDGLEKSDGVVSPEWPCFLRIKY